MFSESTRHRFMVLAGILGQAAVITKVISPATGPSAPIVFGVGGALASISLLLANWSKANWGKAEDEVPLPAPVGTPPAPPK